MKSDAIKKGTERAPHRSLLHAVGCTPEEMERRMHHLHVAIENLHAAGLHDVAERLEQELARARERQQTMAPPREMPPVVARVGEELRRMQAELEELRGQIRALREHIAELHQNREGPR